MHTEFIAMANSPGDVSGVWEGRSLENPNLSLNDPRAWEEAGLSYPSASGVVVNEQTALTYAPVWQAVSQLSGDVAKLPLNVFRRLPAQGDNAREKDRSHPAHRLVRLQPNPETSALEFWRRLMVHALIWNNAYALIVRDGNGNPVELLPLLPDRTRLEDKDGRRVYVTEAGGELRGFAPSQVLHIQGISIAGGDCELVKKARDSWALGLALEKFASKFFTNGARTGGILEIPLGMTKKAADNLVEGFSKTHSGPDNSFKTVILRDGSKFHAAQSSPRDSLMETSREGQVKDVARWYNLPPHKLGAGEKFAYNSLQEENLSYLTGSLSHWLCTIAAECWLKLLSPEEQRADSHFVEHNTRALLQTDTKSQVEIGVAGVTNGLITRNEWRATQNMNPIPGGDAIMMPLNTTTVGEGNDESSGDDERTAIRESVIRALQERVIHETQRVLSAVKAKAKKTQPGKMAKWVEDDLRHTKSVGFTSGLKHCAEPVALLAGMAPEELCRCISDDMFSTLSSDLAGAVERHSSTQPLCQMAVTDSCDTFEHGYVTTIGDTIRSHCYAK